MIASSVCAGDQDCVFLSSLELLTRSAGQEGGSSGSGSEGEEGAAAYARYGDSGMAAAGGEGGSNGWAGAAGDGSESEASAWDQQQAESSGGWQGESESGSDEGSDVSEPAAYGGSSNGSSSNGSNGGAPGGRGKQAGAVQELALDLDSWQQVCGCSGDGICSVSLTAVVATEMEVSRNFNAHWCHSFAPAHRVATPTPCWLRWWPARTA